MKKVITLLVVLLFIVTMLVACSMNELNETTDGADETTNSEVDTTTFTKAPSVEEALECYRQEVAKRAENVNAGNDFLTTDEKEFLQSKGFEIYGNGSKIYDHGDLSDHYNYHYPIIYRKDDGGWLSIWYTDKYGRLCIKKITGVSAWEEYVTIQLHHTLLKGERLLESCEAYSVTYNSNNGIVSFWQMGKLVAEYTVPANSIYTGLSSWVGYLFRDGSDVYSVRDLGCYTNEHGVFLIASNVKEVIIADYHLSNNEWSQPLFLMRDGNLKAYSLWQGSGEPDDESHLVDVRYEGGYDVS